MISIEVHIPMQIQIPNFQQATIIPNPNRQTDDNPIRVKSNKYNIDDLAIIDDEAGFDVRVQRNNRGSRP
jgi:hypothetical protein